MSIGSNVPVYHSPFYDRDEKRLLVAMSISYFTNKVEGLRLT